MTTEQQTDAIPLSSKLLLTKLFFNNAETFILVSPTPQRVSDEMLISKLHLDSSNKIDFKCRRISTTGQVELL